MRLPIVSLSLVALVASVLASVPANAEGPSSHVAPAIRPGAPAKPITAPPKPKFTSEIGKPPASAHGELHVATAKPASAAIARALHLPSSGSSAASTPASSDHKEAAQPAPALGNKITVHGTRNVYFRDGKVWVGDTEKKGRFVLDSKNRLFSESGVGEHGSEGMHYYEKTKVTVAIAFWYPGVGVDDDGHLVLHGVVHPEAGSGYSVRPMTSDPRDGIGPAGGELYRNGKLVAIDTPIVLGGKKVDHALENFSLGEGSNMEPGF